MASTLLLMLLLSCHAHQGDQDDQDAGNLTPLQDDPDVGSLNFPQTIQQVTGIIIW